MMDPTTPTPTTTTTTITPTTPTITTITSATVCTTTTLHNSSTDWILRHAVASKDVNKVMKALALCSTKEQVDDCRNWQFSSPVIFEAAQWWVTSTKLCSNNKNGDNDNNAAKRKRGAAAANKKMVQDAKQVIKAIVDKYAELGCNMKEILLQEDYRHWILLFCPVHVSSGNTTNLQKNSEVLLKYLIHTIYKPFFGNRKTVLATAVQKKLDQTTCWMSTHHKNIIRQKLGLPIFVALQTPLVGILEHLAEPANNDYYMLAELLPQLPFDKNKTKLVVEAEEEEEEEEEEENKKRRKKKSCGWLSNIHDILVQDRLVAGQKPLLLCSLTILRTKVNDFQRDGTLPKPDYDGRPQQKRKNNKPQSTASKEIRLAKAPSGTIYNEKVKIRGGRLKLIEKEDTQPLHCPGAAADAN